MKSKYICIAGKNEIAVKAIDYIIKNYTGKFQIFGLANKNDNGIDGWQPSFKKKLNELNIKSISLDNLYDLENLIFISLEFDKIIRPNKFKTKTLFNIHFSLLPAYKGMYTSAMPFLNNESHTGVTLHIIDKGIDTGEIISQIKFDIDNEDDALSLYNNYNKYAFDLFRSNLQNIIESKYRTYDQPAENSSYYSKNSLDYSNLKIDYNQTAHAIQNQIRAFAFRPYQLPLFLNTNIRFTRITKERSNSKPSTILNEDFFSYKIAAIDYNIILFKDVMEIIFEDVRTKNNKRVISYIEKGFPLDDKDNNGWDILIVATYSGNKEIFDLLISKGTNIKTTYYKKTNLLMYSLTQIEDKSNRYFFDKLLELGLDLNIKDKDGLSTLDWIKKRKIKF